MTGCGMFGLGPELCPSCPAPAAAQPIWLKRKILEEVATRCDLDRERRVSRVRFEAAADSGHRHTQLRRAPAGRPTLYNTRAKSSERANRRYARQLGQTNRLARVGGAADGIGVRKNDGHGFGERLH